MQGEARFEAWIGRVDEVVSGVEDAVWEIRSIADQVVDLWMSLEDELPRLARLGRGALEVDRPPEIEVDDGSGPVERDAEDRPEHPVLGHHRSDMRVVVVDGNRFCIHFPQNAVEARLRDRIVGDVLRVALEEFERDARHRLALRHGHAFELAQRGRALLHLRIEALLAAPASDDGDDAEHDDADDRDDLGQTAAPVATLRPAHSTSMSLAPFSTVESAATKTCVIVPSRSARPYRKSRSRS